MDDLLAVWELQAGERRCKNQTLQKSVIASILECTFLSMCAWFIVKILGVNLQVLKFLSLMLPSIRVLEKMGGEKSWTKKKKFEIVPTAFLSSNNYS